MKIQHKRSAALDGGVAKEPTAAQTEFGELCVNFNSQDPALFIRDNADNIVRIGGDLSLYQKVDEVPNAVFVCPPSEIDTQSPPAQREEGALWWNTEEGILYVWYEDADSSQWVITVPQGGGAGEIPPGTTVDTNPPSPAVAGQLWWNSDQVENGGGRLYVYYDNAWIDTSVPGGKGSYLNETEAKDLFLSKTEDDTAAGQITFEDGINVTGGDATNNIYSQGTGDSEVFQAGLPNGVAGFLSAANAGAGPLAGGAYSQILGATSIQNTTGQPFSAVFYPNFTEADKTTADNFHNVVEVGDSAGLPDSITTINAFSAGPNLSTGKATQTEVRGFLSQINTVAGKTNYNFYAVGDAPNWFTGGLEAAMPADAWGSGNGSDHSYFGITDSANGLLGGLGHQGSFDCSILGGGYRRQSPNEWVSLNVDGNNNACSVQVGASQARIAFCVDANKQTGTSSSITERATVTTAGFASTNLFINVDADDPAAFQTTYSTSGEEQTTYIGEQIDLKAVILELQQAKANLEARVAALEGA